MPLFAPLTKLPSCHPESFDWAQDELREGSRFSGNHEILRCAQNDNTRTRADWLGILTPHETPAYVSLTSLLRLPQRRRFCEHGSLFR